MKIRILSRTDVQRALTMSQCIALVRAAFIELSTGEAVVPLRTQIPVPGHNGVTLIMPAYLARSGDLGCKIVSVFPGNAGRGLATIHAAVFMVDSTTGVPAALLDGTYLTALRTGAASGVATDLLARQDAHVAAIFGAGTQARTQLEAVCTVRHITRALVYDTTPAKAAAYAAEMRARGHPFPDDIRAVASPGEAVREADIICAATTSSTPVFDGNDVRPGTHINAIGAYTPEMQEVDAATIRRATIVVDSLQAALAEAGDLIIPLRQGLISETDIYAEVGEIAAGRRPGRHSQDEITFFKAVGLAVQDMAAAHGVLESAAALGLGTEVEL